MNIGILGGTFDPIHLGHIHIARAALGEYALDRVLFIPAGDPYFKDGTGVSPALTRLEMTSYTLEGMSEPFTVSDMEVAREGRSYTSLTLMKLRAESPSDKLFFILGLDSLRALRTWYRPDMILSGATILCASREGEEEIDEALSRIGRELAMLYPAINVDIRGIHCRELAISSTLIRRKVRMHEEWRDLVHERTYEFIRERGLYL